jgi:hypothetical protein
MMRRIHLSLFAVAVLVFCLAGLASAQSSSTITPARTTVLPAAQVGPVVPGGTEISPLSLGDADAQEQESNGVGVNRTIAKTHGVGVNMKLGKHPKSNPQFNFGFEGLNLFNQRRQSILSGAARPGALRRQWICPGDREHGAPSL